MEMTIDKECFDYLIAEVRKRFPHTYERMIFDNEYGQMLIRFYGTGEHLDISYVDDTDKRILPKANLTK